MNMTTLFFSNTGPMVRYGAGVLEVSNLNPEVETRWVMSRWEMVKLGLKCLRAAFK